MNIEKGPFITLTFFLLLSVLSDPFKVSPAIVLKGWEWDSLPFHRRQDASNNYRSPVKNFLKNNNNNNGNNIEELIFKKRLPQRSRLCI